MLQGLQGLQGGSAQANQLGLGTQGVETPPPGRVGMSTQQEECMLGALKGALEGALEGALDSGASLPQKQGLGQVGKASLGGRRTGGGQLDGSGRAQLETALITVLVDEAGEGGRASQEGQDSR